MTSMAVNQIEFYFTVENLCKDIFIRSYMDEEVRQREFLVGLDHLSPYNPAHEDGQVQRGSSWVGCENVEDTPDSPVIVRQESLGVFIF